MRNQDILKTALLNTPLGPMRLIADEKHLLLLEFEDDPALTTETARIRKVNQGFLMKGTNPIIKTLQKELDAYFEGTLRVFKTPFSLTGTDFQKRVWSALCRIPFGETRSYAAQANAIKQPKAYRAVANANGANCLPIIIPCHRIIQSNGSLGGYSGGIWRKQWLLDHERGQVLR